MTSPTASAVRMYFWAISNVRCPGLLNLERLVTADGHPREPRAAQVVEAQTLAGVVGGEQGFALDADGLQVLAQV